MSVRSNVLAAAKRMRLTSTKMEAPSSTGVSGSSWASTVSVRPPMCPVFSKMVMFRLRPSWMAYCCRWYAVDEPAAPAPGNRQGQSCVTNC